MIFSALNFARSESACAQILFDVLRIFVKTQKLLKTHDQVIGSVMVVK
jgi:hypothetical protein